MKYLLSILIALAICIEFFPHTHAEGPGALGLRKPVNIPVMIDTSGTNITSGAYVQLITAANVTYSYSAILVSNSGAQPLRLATGGSGSEVDTALVIPPSSAVLLPFNGIKATRLSLKSMNATQSSGIVTASFYQ